MGNTPQIAGYLPSGDMGIGLCYQCARHAAVRIVSGQPLDGFVPNFAIVLAPYPEPATGVMLALPVCGECLTGRGVAGAPQQERRIIPASGKVPR
jgi:hypothetical protein